MSEPTQKNEIPAPHRVTQDPSDALVLKSKAKAPLWSGRFDKTPSASLSAFGASLPVDKRLWKEDIAGSKAHAAMLAAQGIIAPSDEEAIRQGLDQVAQEIERDSFVFNAAVDEDIHMAIERRLTELVGAPGARLHTARSRNDQVALDTRLALRRLARKLQAAIEGLESALIERASQEKDTLLPGYTHLQPAQPVRLAHHLLAYGWMLARDWQRTQAAFVAASRSPLGAAALAGTTYPLDREAVAHSLGLAGIVPNSLDAVSDRDYVLDGIYAATTVMIHLSRLCEELVLWSSQEFGFITMDDAHATGSSIMPQKKNPDFAELVRGKSGRVVGDLMGLLTTLKGLPLAYDKDLQEDKEPLFDAFDTATQCLDVVAGMIATMIVHREAMAKAAHEGFMAATDMADYLVSKGVPFREAHGMVGNIVARCVSQGVALQDLSLAELRAFSPVFDDEVFEWITLKNVVNRRQTPGGTGAKALKDQIALIKEELARQQALRAQEE